MAKVTITLTDKRDGSLNMKIESDPAFPNRSTKT